MHAIIWCIILQRIMYEISITVFNNTYPLKLQQSLTTVATLYHKTFNIKENFRQYLAQIYVTFETI